MDWLNRSLSRSSRNTKTPDTQTQPNTKEEESIYGITDELINHVKSFTIDSFKNFPLQDDDEGSYGEETQSSSTKAQNDLSRWQEKHAILILSRVKASKRLEIVTTHYAFDKLLTVIRDVISDGEISQLRYVLCPRQLKENQFWKIYFKLARSHVLEYELRDIQQEKLKQMAMEDEKSSNNNPYEVEMADIEPLPPS